MNIYELAAMTAYYGDDERVVPVDGSYVVHGVGYDWVVARADDMCWWAYNRVGEPVMGPHDTPDEAIFDLIGDPR